MAGNLDNLVKELLCQANSIVNQFYHSDINEDHSRVNIPASFQRDFLGLIDRVTLSLMEDKDNFYGYFLFQMAREIRFDISSPTGVNFKGAKFVIYFNPLLFLNLNLKQMESYIKHEILHILSQHLIRAKELKRSCSTLVINIAMDLVVNQYLNELPPYAITLERVSQLYALRLEPYASFEYYAKQLQTAMDLDLREEDKEMRGQVMIETEYSEARTHDLWEESGAIEDKTLLEFTDKVIQASEKGEIPTDIRGLIEELRRGNGEMPWNLYLNRLMGTVESNKKKTITRRNRRQSERLDLRGELRSHKARILVAVDISGSISDSEFKQAMKEVLDIVKNYSHEITVVECDDQLRSVIKVKTVKDLRERTKARGGTKFSPVFDYANHHKFNLLVYFTDGKGEDRLLVTPRGYKILWIICGKGNELSIKEPYGAIKKLGSPEPKEEILDIGDVAMGGFSMNNQEKI